MFADLLKFLSRQLVLIIALFSLAACADAKQTQLEKIQERGELRVLSRHSLTSYFAKGDQLAGFEYELAQRFAERLGVELEVITPENLGDILGMLAEGRGDIAAAGLTVTPERQQNFRFGPVYHEVTQQLIYRQGNGQPEDITDLGDDQLEVVASSSHVEQLEELQQEVPALEWTTNSDLDNSSLLELVQLEMIDYTIADSNEFAANQNLFPELRVAFDISDPQPLAWALNQNQDNSLLREVRAFFDDIEGDGFLDQLIEKYYGHIRRFDYVDTRALHRRILTHLPLYQDYLENAAAKYGFDWRLLAAIAYQESHWNPDAVSSTGVRGLMMLTQATAGEMGIADREDPRQSIFAGAKYLDELRQRLPERIEDPDRTWLALAAYNIGMAHLEDARVLTERNGGNPDLWQDVRENLPLLAKRKWFEQTQYGYARGGEPVRYVGNIRRYYDIMLHHQYGSADNPILPEPPNNNTLEVLPPPAL